MRGVGIQGTMLGWVKNFLSDRLIQFKIGRDKSEPVVVGNGPLPSSQGGVLQHAILNIHLI